MVNSPSKNRSSETCLAPKVRGVSRRAISATPEQKRGALCTENCLLIFNEVLEPRSDTEEGWDFAVRSRLWRDSSLEWKTGDNIPPRAD